MDIVKTSVQQSLAQTTVDARSSRASVSPEKGVRETHRASLDVTDLSSKEQVADMAARPPINIEAVSRIKEAIASGNYPIDLDRVSEKLFENYLEMQE